MVELALRIRVVEVYGRGHRLMSDRREARDRLESSRAAHQMARHALRGTHRHSLDRGPERPTNRPRLGHIAHRRAGGMGVDVVNLIGGNMRIGERLRDREGSLRGIAARAHHVGGIARHAHPGQFPIHAGPAGPSCGERLEHEACPSLAHHESITIAIERPRGSGRIVAAAGECAEIVEGG